jgi:hypothetical protein
MLSIPFLVSIAVKGHRSALSIASTSWVALLLHHLIMMWLSCVNGIASSRLVSLV